MVVTWAAGLMAVVWCPEIYRAYPSVVSVHILFYKIGLVGIVDQEFSPQLPGSPDHLCQNRLQLLQYTGV